MLRNFEEANKLLRSYIPAAGHFRDNYTLDNMRAMMTALGNPQEQYKVVHIAGTSGKTSTAYFVAGLLQQTSAKVGLTVSPHIDEVNERVQINLEPLSEPRYCEELDTFINLINKLSIKPSYFELLVAFAFWEFARQKVDYAVVEVGLGGLLDATNVINRADKVCVITDIGLDHTAILGETLAEIAKQKAGIIAEGNHVFCMQQSPEIQRIFKTSAERHNAHLHVGKHIESHDELPAFQNRNWSLAHNVVDYVIVRDSLPALSSQQKTRARQIHIPARMERFDISGKKLYLDGSHNAQKVTALVQSLQHDVGGERLAVLFSLVQDKDASAKEVLAQLRQLTDTIVLTEFAGAQDMPKASLNLDELVALAKAVGFKTIIAEKNPSEAYRRLLQQDDDVCLVTGSFYLLNHIRPLVLNGNHD